ncbi:MAG: hypothetical protein HQL56_15245 [Magnetococcales bacterium]|nr:hypothetical protein [Magnetococcales bacterium]
MTSFNLYIGIDYSRAKTPSSSLPGLRVFTADRDHEPVEELPPPSPRNYWTRRGIAEWLAALYWHIVSLNLWKRLVTLKNRA